MKLTYLISGLLVISLAGCANKKHEAEQQAFFPDQRGSAVNRLADAQAANGARHDATLYPAHFEGDRLSSLGRQKLSLMVASGATANPMTIYLVNDGKGDQLEQRKQAVRDYLNDSLRPGERIEFAEGPNPNTVHPSAEALARMGKLESPGAGNQSDSSMGSGGTPAPSPMK